jgi:hypothetical protein
MEIIKLYFMVGLPTETQADLEAIVSLVKRLKMLTKKNGFSGKINVSAATFVPKAHTPFQWESMISLESATEKINWLKANLKMPGVQMKWQDPRVSRIEGVWARGDRTLNRVLLRAWKSGCRFDGWTDYFNYDKWIRVFQESGIKPASYTGARSDTEQPLPWDHIHIGVDRSFLLKEKARATDGQITDDCRTGSCSGCGVCDFDTIKPISFHDQSRTFFDEHRGRNVAWTRPLKMKHKYQYVVKFKKMKSSRFLGHLEMAKHLHQRASAGEDSVEIFHRVSSHAKSFFWRYAPHGYAKRR